VRRQEKARARWNSFYNRRKIFVEGDSGQIINKALRICRRKAAEIDVETKVGAGITTWIDMLQSWRSRAKHHPELPKAAGLLDLTRSEDALKNWNNVCAISIR
jgi:hypothetical protein